MRTFVAGNPAALQRVCEQLCVSLHAFPACCVSCRFPVCIVCWRKPVGICRFVEALRRVTTKSDPSDVYRWTTALRHFWRVCSTIWFRSSHRRTASEGFRKSKREEKRSRCVQGTPVKRWRKWDSVHPTACCLQPRTLFI